MISNNLLSFIFSFFLFSTLVGAQNIEIDTIILSGNKRTKDFVILRELVLHDNQVVSKDSLDYLLELSKNRVMNLNLFNSVDIDTIHHNDQIQLNITVIEKWYNWPIPFIEFSDRNFNVWSNLRFDPLRTNYGIYLFNYNLWGRNHTLKTSFVYGYNRTYGIEYRMPFLSKSSNIGISSTVKYTSQSEMWLSTQNDELQFFKNQNSNLIQKKQTTFRVSKRLDPYTSAAVNMAAIHIRLDSTLDNLAKHYLLDNILSRTQMELGASVERDKRNNIYLPTIGIYTSSTISYQHFSGTNAINNVYVSGKAQTFNHIAKNWYTAFSAFGEINTVKILPYENSRRFGYANLVRGFEKYVVEGRSSVLANTALRYQLADKKRFDLPFIPIKSYNFLPITMFAEYFVDAGYVFSSNALNYNILPNRLLYSTGIGLQMAFYNDRIMRLEFSVNSLKESGLFVHFRKAI